MAKDYSILYPTFESNIRYFNIYLSLSYVMGFKEGHYSLDYIFSTSLVIKHNWILCIGSLGNVQTTLKCQITAIIWLFSYLVKNYFCLQLLIDSMDFYSVRHCLPYVPWLLGRAEETGCKHSNNLDGNWRL